MEKPSFVCDGMLFHANGSQYSSLDLDTLPISEAPRHVLVLGMGRGGTTACAQILSALGFVCDTEGNPVLESKRLRALKIRGRKQEFLDEVARWDSGPDRWFWKEPKLHSGDFRHAVLSAPASVGFLVVFRDVFNVALRNHYVMDIEFFPSLQKAARNNLMIAEFVALLKDRKIAIVSYEKLLLHTPRIVRGLARYLGIVDEPMIDAAIRTIAPEAEHYQEAVARGAALLKTKTADEAIQSDAMHSTVPQTIG